MGIIHNMHFISKSTTAFALELKISSTKSCMGKSKESYLQFGTEGGCYHAENVLLSSSLEEVLCSNPPLGFTPDTIH